MSIFTIVLTSTLVLTFIPAAIGCDVNGNGYNQQTTTPLTTSTPTSTPIPETPTPVSTTTPLPTATRLETTQTPTPQTAPSIDQNLELNQIDVYQETLDEWTICSYPGLGAINIIECDEAGRMWIGTDGWGLLMFDGQYWYNWQPENRSDMREDAIRGLAIHDNKVYAGVFGHYAGGGVQIYDIEKDQWINLWPDDSELSGGGVGGIAVDNNGRAYFPTAEGILDIYHDGTWEHIIMTPSSPCNYIYTYDGLFDGIGNYWLATQRCGLWRYDGDKWKIYSLFEGQASIVSLAVDHEGNLWVGTSRGLAVYTLDGTWYTCTSDESPFCEGWQTDIAVDSQGLIWIVSQNKLSVFNGQDWQTFTPDVAGAEHWGWAVECDQQGRVWVATFHDLAIFSGQAFVSTTE